MGYGLHIGICPLLNFCIFLLCVLISEYVFNARLRSSLCYLVFDGFFLNAAEVNARLIII